MFSAAKNPTKNTTGFLSSLQRIMHSGPVWTVGNFFSLLRILLLPFIVIGLLYEHNFLTVTLIILVGLSDGLDGFFARYYNQISNLGKLLDPLADKVAFGVLICFLALWRDFPMWAVLIFVIRDIFILIAAAWLVNIKNQLVMSNFFGKLTLVGLFLTTILYTLRWELTGFYLLLASLFCLGLSTWQYWHRFRRLLATNG